jgi:hypothetical protein
MIRCLFGLLSLILNPLAVINGVLSVCSTVGEYVVIVTTSDGATELIYSFILFSSLFNSSGKNTMINDNIKLLKDKMQRQEISILIDQINDSLNIIRRYL